MAEKALDIGPLIDAALNGLLEAAFTSDITRRLAEAKIKQKHQAAVDRGEIFQPNIDASTSTILSRLNNIINPDNPHVVTDIEDAKAIMNDLYDRQDNGELTDEEQAQIDMTLPQSQLDQFYDFVNNYQTHTQITGLFPGIPPNAPDFVGGAFGTGISPTEFKHEESKHDRRQEIEMTDLKQDLRDVNDAIHEETDPQELNNLIQIRFSIIDTINARDTLIEQMNQLQGAEQTEEEVKEASDSMRAYIRNATEMEARQARNVAEEGLRRRRGQQILDQLDESLGGPEVVDPEFPEADLFRDERRRRNIVNRLRRIVGGNGVNGILYDANNRLLPPAPIFIGGLMANTAAAQPPPDQPPADRPPVQPPTDRPAGQPPRIDDAPTQPPTTQPTGQPFKRPARGPEVIDPLSKEKARAPGGDARQVEGAKAPIPAGPGGPPATHPSNFYSLRPIKPISAPKLAPQIVQTIPQDIQELNDESLEEDQEQTVLTEFLLKGTHWDDRANKLYNISKFNYEMNKISNITNSLDFTDSIVKDDTIYAPDYKEPPRNDIFKIPINFNFKVKSPNIPIPRSGFAQQGMPPTKNDVNHDVRKMADVIKAVNKKLPSGYARKVGVRSPLPNQMNDGEILSAPNVPGYQLQASVQPFSKVDEYKGFEQSEIKANAKISNSFVSTYSNLRNPQYRVSRKRVF